MNSRLNSVHSMLARVAVGASLLLLAGCASVSVVPTQPASTALSKPSHIYVKPFDTTTGKWEKATSGETARKQINDTLTAQLESRLGEIVPTTVVGAETPTEGWLVTGNYIRVNPGDKWARMMIGLGAGGSKLELEVRVYDLARSATTPATVFKTTGGSNQQGGMSTFNNATEDDVDRSVREIRDYLRKIVDGAGA